MADVLITERITGPGIDRLDARFTVQRAPHLWQSPGDLLAAVRDIRALVVRNQTQVTAELLAAAPKLEIVARAGVGLDNVDVAAATAAGVVVTYTPAANAVSVAELTLGLLLTLVRRIAAADADTRQGGWNRARFTGGELAGKTLGLIGFGRIGQLVTARAAAFEMPLLVCDPLADRDAAQAIGARICPLPELLAKADIVSCHVPLLNATRGLVNAAFLAQMKPGAALVNTSRGEIVVESDLLAALESGRLAGAALDVRCQEPPTVGSLEELPNVVLTPHVGAFTVEAQDRVAFDVARDVAAVLTGAAALDFVNFPRPRRTAL